MLVCTVRFPELVPAAKFLRERLQRLVPNATVYNGLSLNESLVLDGSGGLCIQEPNTLYQVCFTAEISRLLPLAITYLPCGNECPELKQWGFLHLHDFLQGMTNRHQKNVLCL